ncbi:hypothetical protein FQN57_000646 [Myotisia sp. PD_48]|nr:hypothetical protein FQN57_000646 [Myotisia sp. PD_48]
MRNEPSDAEEGLSGTTATSPLNDVEPDTTDSDGLLPFGLSGGDPSALPVWLQERSKSFRWGWVPLPLRKVGRATYKWLKGPQPPQPLQFTPLFPLIQEAPVLFLERFFPKKKQKIGLLLGLYFTWFLTWSLILRRSVSTGYIEGYGRPQPISCSSSYWSSGNRCGLNGSLKLLSPYTVGNQTLNYQPLIIGGPVPGSPDEGTYRADSFICQAAIHSGVISRANGGCGVVKLTGSSHEYHSSEGHGFLSTAFKSTFPKSFKFLKISSSESNCPRDMRWPLFALTAATLVILSIFTTSPAVFFFSTFFILIMHVGLVSDPPGVSGVLELLSLLFSRLLPAGFVAYVLYLYCGVPLLKPLSSPAIYQFSRTILYLGPAFVGALNNYTFAMWIPLQRLTPHDIKNQPGAPIALAIVLTIIISVVLSQAWQIRKGGLLLHFLKIYLVLGTGVVILLILPGLRLRIHHYILAILLMPGTGIPTRPSLIYQGLLLGLFVNGIGRWGFASIIQTPDALGELPGAGTWWGATSPNITNSSVSVSLAGPGEARFPGYGNISFSLWDYERMDKLEVDGISVLVNDVERWRGYLDEDSHGKFNWHRRGYDELNQPDNHSPSFGSDYNDLSHDSEKIRIVKQDYPDVPPEDLFFRFAFLKGSSVGLYGDTGVWLGNGDWISPSPPPT